MKNLSLERSCSGEKLVIEVILDGGMNLKKGVIDKSDRQKELDCSKVVIVRKNCRRKRALVRDSVSVSS